MSLMQQHVLYVLLCTVLELSYKKVFTFSTVDEILELSIQEVFKEAERRGKIAYSMGCKLRSLYSTRNNLVIKTKPKYAYVPADVADDKLGTRLLLLRNRPRQATPVMLSKLDTGCQM